MKKQVLNYLMIMVVALSTSLSVANPDKPSTSIATFQFENVYAGELLSIYTSKDEILYTEYIDEPGVYRKNYDLSLLKNGSYFITLDRSEKLETQSFTILNGIVNSVSEKIIVYKPTANLINDKLYVSQHTTETSTLDIELYFNGKLIHDTTAQGKGAIGKIYQLDLSKKGTYRVIMKSHGKVFKTTIEI